MNNGGPKSHTKVVVPNLLHYCLGLSNNLLIDMLSQAGLDPTNDLATLADRTKAEGLGFLTKTLPRMGKAIQAALLGRRLSIPCFRTMHGTVLPHFLKGLLSRCFTADGYVREDIEIVCLNDLVQFCFLFYKLEVPYESKTEQNTIIKFVQTDAGLPDSYSHLGEPLLRDDARVLQVARRLISAVVRPLDPRCITPRHGPGAVATGERPYDKYAFKRIYRSVEAVYPLANYFYLSPWHLIDTFATYEKAEKLDSPVAKVMLVPKDSRGPRLISCEPLEVQFVQQGLGSEVVKCIESHPFTRGHVNFTDQEVNQKLALKGSVDGSWATLDMKDASDRVSLALVKELFGGTALLPFLLGTRSTHTKLPNGEIVGLRKFAPMGSALCFPVEALCFWALAVACVYVYCGASLRLALRGIYVYGDDVVVRKGYENALLQHFHYYSLKFNESKCCTTGNFRESCGVDAFKGVIITPIKIRRLPPSSKSDGKGFTSAVSLRNALFQRGYYRASTYVQEHVESLFGQVPYSGRDCHRIYGDDYEFQSKKLYGNLVGFSDSAPCWYTRLLPTTSFPSKVAGSLHHKWRYNLHLQRVEYLTLRAAPVVHEYKGISAWGELMRTLTSRGASNDSALDYLCPSQGVGPFRYADRRSVKLTRRWSSLAY